MATKASTTDANRPSVIQVFLFTPTPFALVMLHQWSTVGASPRHPFWRDALFDDYIKWPLSLQKAFGRPVQDEKHTRKLFTKSRQLLWDARGPHRHWAPWYPWAPWSPRQVHQYTMGPRTEVQPSPQESIIGRTVNGNDVEAPIAAFLTPTRFYDAEEASKRLALSYQPRYSYACEPVIGEGLPRFRDSYGRADRWSRVWPAFGQPGGALESLLVAGTINRVHLLETWRPKAGFPYMKGINVEHPGLLVAFTSAAGLGRGKTGGDSDNRSDSLEGRGDQRQKPDDSDTLPDPLQGDGDQRQKPDDSDTLRGPSEGDRDQGQEPDDPVPGGRFVAARGKGLVYAILQSNRGCSVSLTSANGGSDLVLWSAAWRDQAPMRLVSQQTFLKFPVTKWFNGDGIVRAALQSDVRGAMQKARSLLDALGGSGHLEPLPAPYILSEI